MTKKRRGRPAKYKTPEERREAIRAYQKSYLAVRRKKYSEDPEYRSKVQGRRRSGYKRGRAVDFRAKRYGRNLGKAHQFASEDGLLSWYAMARFLSMERRVFGLWVRQGKFPSGNRGSLEAGENFYTVKYAEALATVLDTLRGRRSFRRTDFLLIRRLFAIESD